LGINEERAILRIDNPTEFTATIQTEQDFFDDFSEALVGGENFNDPVGIVGNRIGNFPVFILGDSRPTQHGNIWNDRSPIKRTAQFRQG
jgi:hypothetical protein